MEPVVRVFRGGIGQRPFDLSSKIGPHL